MDGVISKLGDGLWNAFLMGVFYFCTLACAGHFAGPPEAYAAQR